MRPAEIRIKPSQAIARSGVARTIEDLSHGAAQIKPKAPRALVIAPATSASEIPRAGGLLEGAVKADEPRIGVIPL